MHTKSSQGRPIVPTPCVIPSYNFQEILTVIKRLTNAQSVINRLLKGREPGAWAEVEIAYLINRAGYRVVFSSPKATALNPDLIAWIDGHKINIETMFMQRPTGGWRGPLPKTKPPEVDRIKRAIDNKSRQLPKDEPGIIILYNQEVKMGDLQNAMDQLQERLSRYPYIKALIVIKDLTSRDRSLDLSTNLPQFWIDRRPARGGSASGTICPYIVSQKETDVFLFAKTRLNRRTRYIFCVKGTNLQPGLLEGIKKIFIPAKHPG